MKIKELSKMSLSLYAVYRRLFCIQGNGVKTKAGSGFTQGLLIKKT